MKALVIALATALAMAGAATAALAGDADAGKDQAKKCAACHGKNGEGKGKNPAIAGQTEAAFVEAMNAYKTGAKDHKMMVSAAKKLSDEDIANLAAYYASLK